MLGAAQHRSCCLAAQLCAEPLQQLLHVLGSYASCVAGWVCALMVCADSMWWLCSHAHPGVHVGACQGREGKGGGVDAAKWPCLLLVADQVGAAGSGALVSVEACSYQPHSCGQCTQTGPQDSSYSVLLTRRVQLVMLP